MMYLQYNCTKAKHSIMLGSVLFRNSKKIDYRNTKCIIEFNIKVLVREFRLNNFYMLSIHGSTIVSVLNLVSKSFGLFLIQPNGS